MALTRAKPSPVSGSHSTRRYDPREARTSGTPISAATKRESTRQFLKAGRPQGTSSLKNAAPAANDTAVKVSNDKRICHGANLMPPAVGLDGGATMSTRMRSWSASICASFLAHVEMFQIQLWSP